MGRNGGGVMGGLKGMGIGKEEGRGKGRGVQVRGTTEKVVERKKQQRGKVEGG